MPGEGVEQQRALKILHVDDDPMNLRVVQEILGAFGHTTWSASGGPQALEHLSREIFDVILMDIHMPQMSGIEVVRRLRASVGPERNTPVIALTADVVSRRPDEYLSLGFDGFVSKPILVAKLLAAVIQAAAEPHRAKPAVARAG